MVHRFCQFYMSEMTGAICHISSTSLATRIAIDGSLSWIHEATQLWPTAFHCFWVFNASFSRDRHLFLLKKKSQLQHVSTRTTTLHKTGHFTPTNFTHVLKWDCDIFVFDTQRVRKRNWIKYYKIPSKIHLEIYSQAHLGLLRQTALVLRPVTGPVSQTRVP